MSSQSEITINGHTLVNWGSTYYEWYFIKSDRQRYVEQDLEKDEVEKFIGYRAKASVIRKRLQLDGYDNNSLELDFNETRAKWIKDMKEMLSSYREDYSKKGDAYYLTMVNEINEQLSLVQKTSFEEWKAAFPEALRLKDEHIPNIIGGYEVKIENEPLLSLMLSPLIGVYDQDYGFAGSMFPCMQMESYATLLLDICEDDDRCELDITDIVDGGWVDDFDDIFQLKEGKTFFYKIFENALIEIKDIKLDNSTPVLQRMIFSSVITAMEAYLSDTMKRYVLNRHAIKRRFVESYSSFTNKKIQANTVFSFMDSLDREITNEIDKISFHNINLVTGLYKNVLLCEFPKDKVARLSDSVDIRHDIVHRNGFNKDKELIHIEKEDVIELIELVTDVVSYIDKQILDGIINSDTEF